MHQFTQNLPPNSSQHTVDCCNNPDQSLTDMFVNIVQRDRIEAGQCPALRAAFLKPHGVAHGTFKMRSNVQDDLAVGLFAGDEYPLWARFSSDTLPSISDYKTTLGIGLKLFNTPTPKIFGLPDDNTFDFIMQNFSEFFVDTAKDMCEFTKAGVIDGDYGPYLKAHPRTATIIEEMAKPVGSALASPYWAILPFSLGKNQYVKYMLRPTISVPSPSEAPQNPDYLAEEMASRLKQGAVSFEFCVQLRTNPETMPLDQASVPWSEQESPFIAIADITFPQQDIHERGQAAYGENLSMNIWRVTKEHKPVGSIAEARKVVYEASANQRRNVNGVPDGEPDTLRPSNDFPAPKDTKIVKAMIHPSIGVARVGNAKNAFFIGPEVTEPKQNEPGFYRTANDKLKRQAARFRIYGYNAAGEVVAELTSNSADINWQVHVANRKSDWFEFIQAMDVPESHDLVLKRRNPKLWQPQLDAAKLRAQREQLIIDPGTRSIGGCNKSGDQYKFDSAKFKDTPVYLGELQTDKAGRLLFLGGHGVSESPSGLPPYDENNPDTFNNAPDWYDDIADGPVNAQVSIDGQNIPVTGAWVISAPPNYAPGVVSWRTMYDLMVDLYTANGWMAMPTQTSFTHDVLPLLRRMSNLQWVNKGFFSMFGKGRPMDFNDPELIARLAATPASPTQDTFGELRNQLFRAFRPHNTEVNSPPLWPWLYGDTYGGELDVKSPRTMLALPELQQWHLQNWASGKFINDWNPKEKVYRSIDKVPLAEQPAMLDKASLHFCLADAFHPGCEITWPMRHMSMYSAPFRIRENPNSESPTEYGFQINQQQMLALNGPLHAQVAGGLTRWMGVPWQGDTAFCRAGYDADYDQYQPSFWPAHVPNNVLSESDYLKVIDTSLDRTERLAAYSRRLSWNRFMDRAGDTAKIMERMIAEFSLQGIVEPRPGVKNDPDFPSVIYVENNAYLKQMTLLSAQLKTTSASNTAQLKQAQAVLKGEELEDAEANFGSEALRLSVIKMRSRQVNK